MRLFPLGARAGRSGTLLIWGLAVYLLDGGVVRLLKARGVTPLNPKFAVSLSLDVWCSGKLSQRGLYTPLGRDRNR